MRIDHATTAHSARPVQHDVPTVGAPELRMPIGTTDGDLWFQSLVRTFRVNANASKLRRPVEQNVWVYACAQSWSRNIARVPFQLIAGDQATGEGDVVTGGELVDLLSDPNPMMTEVLFWQAVIMGLALDGEAIIVKEGKGDERVEFGAVPTELWPMPAGLFKHHVDKSTSLIDRWEMHVGGEVIHYQPHEILHVRFWNPNDFYRGLAPLKAAMMGVEQDWNSAVYNRSFFSNGADPGGVLMTDQPLGGDQARRERQRFEERHAGGPGKSHRVSVLTHGLKYESLSSNRREMEYLEGRKWNRAEVLAAYGTPPTEIGIADDVNQENSKTFRKIYWENHLLPVMEIVAGFFNGDAFLGSLSGRGASVARGVPSSSYFRWDTSGIKALQADIDKLLDAAERMHKIGVPLDVINERLGLGLPDDMPGASMGYLPGTLLPVPMIGTQQEAKPPKVARGGVIAVADARRACSCGARAIDAVVRDSDTGEADPRWLAYERNIFAPMEKAWAGKMRRFFHELRTEQLRLFDKAVEAAGASDDDRITQEASAASAELKGLSFRALMAALFNRKTWAERLARLTKPLMRRTTELAIDSIETEIGGFTAFGGHTDPSIVTFISERTPKLADDVTGTVSKRLRNQMVEGVAKDETVGDLRKRIKKEFNFANKRATTVARTETAIGTNGARDLAMRAEDIDEHEWVTAGDEIVRETHAAQGGVIVRVGEPFPNGLMHPSDPNGLPGEIINCRCVAVPVIE